MWQPFSESARRSLVLAQELAQQFGNSFIDADHVFVGIVTAGNSDASRALADLGVDEQAVLAAAESAIPHGEGSGAEMAFTSRAKRMIEYSFEESRSLNTNFIGAEHLILGYLRESTGGSDLMRTLGIDGSELRARIVASLKGPRKTGKPRASLDATFNAAAVVALRDADDLWRLLSVAAGERDAHSALLYALALCRQTGGSAHDVARSLDAKLGNHPQGA